MTEHYRGDGSPYSISKDFHFSAAHRLLDLPREHKCSNLHGHNWIVRVTLSGPLGTQGFVRDYGDLSPVKTIIDGSLDHAVLVAEPDLELFGMCQRLRTKAAVLPIENTSAELLASYLAKKFAEYGFEIAEIGISETPKAWAHCHYSHLPGE